MESALKNAATAQESYLTTSTAYTNDTGVLASEGLKAAPDVTIAVVNTTGLNTRYCMRATHSSLTSVTYYYSSDTGRPTTVACT